jgi:hypothetical protein
LTGSVKDIFGTLGVSCLFTELDAAGLRMIGFDALSQALAAAGLCVIGFAGLPPALDAESSSSDPDFASLASDLALDFIWGIFRDYFDSRYTPTSSVVLSRRALFDVDVSSASCIATCSAVASLKSPLLPLGDDNDVLVATPVVSRIPLSMLTEDVRGGFAVPASVDARSTLICGQWGRERYHRDVQAPSPTSLPSFAHEDYQ